MYNLTVDEAHTFFVGDEQWLVHNCDPFELAKAGGRHAGWYENMLGKSDAEIERGIRSLEAQITEHQGYIADPRSKIPNWDQLDSRQQIALVEKKWPGDMTRQSEQKAILEGIFRERRK
jgi:hypothetical protein